MLLRALILAALMCAASVAAVVMRPTVRIAEQGPKIDLEIMIPKQFGDWKFDPTVIPITVAPDVQAKLEALYNQTLSRTYVNGNGQRIMLSIAYGNDQRDSISMHYPEACYPSQGFQTKSISNGFLMTTNGKIRVKHLEMALGQRNEPITYWTMIGELQSLGGIDKKLNEMRYRFQGIIPDGLLFRISSIESDAQRAFREQEDFVRSLLDSLKPEARKRLAGI